MSIFSNSIYASNSCSEEPNNDNKSSSEQKLSIGEQHHAVYWISQRSCADANYDSYVNQVNFTVSWEYSGPSSHPAIAYTVTISSPFDGTLAKFQDSAIGQPVGAKNYSIKVNSSAVMGAIDSNNIYIRVEGADGSELL